MNANLNQLDSTQLRNRLAEWQRQYELVAGNRLALDLSRGKPAADQLALSDGLDGILQGNYKAADGTDTRNYGGARGLPEARELGAELLGVPAEIVIAAGNSSLNLMHLVAATALSHGLWSDERAWSTAANPTLLTPVPGYDRHFDVTRGLGIDTHNVSMTPNGPDMAEVNAAVAENPNIKGIWCVPKYSNPTGCIYSDATVDALANLPAIAAADDFVVLWDNAYAVHDLTFPPPRLASIYSAAETHGTGDHIVQFASTSKITHAGAGVAFLASSTTVLATLEAQLQFMTIGPDKVNQLRHCRFLGGHLQAHMQAHAELLKPKFAAVQHSLQTELADLGIATWTEPQGGYFVSLNTLPGLASKVVALASEVGLKLTPAGATFPGAFDPHDSNVRIAPTFANLQDLQAAMHVLTLCIKLASAQQLLSSRADGDSPNQG